MRLLVFLFLSFHALFAFSKGCYFFPEIPLRDVSLKDLDKSKAVRTFKELPGYKSTIGLADVLDTVNHFYSSDIDGDKKSELIYYGMISDGGYWTVIWKADGSSYRLQCKLYGKINGVSDSLFISTLAPACRGPNCGHANLYCGYANLYRIIDGEADFMRSVAIFKGMALFDSLPVKKRIVINDSGHGLRTQPVINDQPDSTDMEKLGVLRGNILVGLGKGITACATVERTDKGGKVWWFLVLDNQLDAEYNVYKEFRQNNRQICGWICADGLDFREVR
jgi:hypothetical protein